MSNFNIRVELHRATPQDYTKLAENLRAINVVDTIKSDEGLLYKLPPAEYCFDGNATLDNVRQAVKAAAAKVGKEFAIVVTQGICGWYNLPRA